VFLKVSGDEEAQLRSQGYDFYEWGPGQIRFVTSWDQQADDVERLASAIAAL
jgi:threonine aldolase